MNLKNNILFKTSKATLIALCIIILFYLLFGLVPQLFGYKLSEIYVQTAFAVSSFVYVPYALYLSKKWNINFKKQFKILSKWHNVLYLFAFIIVAYIATLVIIDSIEDIFELAKGRINKIFIKIPSSFNTVGIIKTLRSVIIAPVSEELFFRGLIMIYLLRKFTVLKSLIISSLLFSLIHLRFDDFFLLFFWGIVFGLVFYKTGSLLMSMVAHSVSNLIGTNIEIEKVSLDVVSSLYVVLIIVGFIFVVVITAYLVAIKDVRYKEV